MDSGETRKYPCVVCGCMKFTEPPGSHDICDVCGWEDDGVQANHPRMRGGANGGSVFDYQQDAKSWSLEGEERDDGWRALRYDEFPLPDGSEGTVDYALDLYKGREPYYWRDDDL